MRVVLVAGTRPELIKLHPIAVALAAARLPAILVTTGQHRLPSMRDAFVEGLEWPCAVVALGAPEEPARLLATLAAALPPRLRPDDLVVVEGDTTSVLATAVLAKTLGLPLAHVEAGLRSFDERMPEERNRRVADHLADLLFAPTARDAAQLEREGCGGAVFVVGNTVLDAVRLNIARAPTAPFGGGYVLVTLHRQENVDDPAFITELVDFLAGAGRPCVFPVHPRTRDRLARQGLWPKLAGAANLRLEEPLDYPTFLGAMRDARVIVTDSGGVQEEATAAEIRRPVVVVRRSTERVPALEAGFSVLVEGRAARIRERVEDLSWFRPAPASPFGDGRAAEAIVQVLRERSRAVAT